MKQVPLVVAVLGAALAGGLVGGSLRPTARPAQAPPASPAPPAEQAAESDPNSAKELAAPRREIRSMRSVLWEGDDGSTHGTRESQRRPAIPSPPVLESLQDLHTELAELRKSLRALEEAVREDALGPPTDALLNARRQDRVAVQLFIDSFQADPERARGEAIGKPYEVLVDRFGRPYEIWKKKQWIWRGLGDRDPKLCIRVEFSEGVAGRVHLHSWD